MLKTTRNTWLMLDNIHLTCDKPNCTNGYSTELPDAVYAQSDERLQTFYRTLEARGWSTNLQTKRAFCPNHSIEQIDYRDLYPYREAMIKAQSGFERSTAIQQRQWADHYALSAIGPPRQPDSRLSAAGSQIAGIITSQAPPKHTLGQGWTRGHNWSHRVCSGPSFGSSSSVPSSALAASARSLAS